MAKQSTLKIVNPNAAGIDIGSKEHYVAVPLDKTSEPVRSFQAFTDDLEEMSKWLKENQVDTVAMESTGVYWIPVYEYLESKGFEVLLVNARHIKNLKGRKTDVADCQWLQQLHSHGLLEGAFRPHDEYCILRGYVRQRKKLVEYQSKSKLHMQKALVQMNIQLNNVTSSITSKTGMAIIRDIVSGQRNPHKLAKHRDRRCKFSLEELMKSLKGNYRQEHLFALKQSLELYDIYQEKIDECDVQIESYLEELVSGKPEEESDKDDSDGDAKTEGSTEEKLSKIFGVDLTKIEGVSLNTTLVVLAEVGADFSKFQSSKQFAAWLRLCPGNQISGGKILNSRTLPSSNRLRTALKMSACTIQRSKTALGAFYRKIRARAGTAKAIVATAHKLAKYIYAMVTKGEEYVLKTLQEYEDQYKDKVRKSLEKKAEGLGLKLVQAEV